MRNVPFYNWLVLDIQLMLTVDSCSPAPRKSRESHTSLHLCCCFPTYSKIVDGNFTTARPGTWGCPSSPFSSMNGPAQSSKALPPCTERLQPTKSIYSHISRAEMNTVSAQPHLLLPIPCRCFDVHLPSPVPAAWLLLEKAGRSLLKVSQQWPTLSLGYQVPHALFANSVYAVEQLQGS